MQDGKGDIGAVPIGLDILVAGSILSIDALSSLKIFLRLCPFEYTLDASMEKKWGNFTVECGRC